MEDQELQEEIEEYLHEKQEEIKTNIPIIKTIISNKNIMDYYTELADNPKSEFKFVCKIQDVKKEVKTQKKLNLAIQGKFYRSKKDIEDLNILKWRRNEKMANTLLVQLDSLLI